MQVNIRGLNSSRDDVLLGLLIHEGNSSDPESCAANITGPRYYPFSTNAKQMNVFMDSEIAQQYFMMREFAFFKPNADGAVEDLVLSAPNIYLWCVRESCRCSVTAAAISSSPIEKQQIVALL